jgi:hypothetical protein
MIRTSFIAVTAASAVGFEPEASPAAAAAGFPLRGTDPSYHGHLRFGVKSKFERSHNCL